jgi:single-stranded DNA-binding protein
VGSAGRDRRPVPRQGPAGRHRGPAPDPILDDEKGTRHWKTEIVAANVEMLSGRRKKDYEAEQAADSLVAQAEALGEAPATEPIAEDGLEPETDDDEGDEADPPRRC